MQISLTDHEARSMMTRGAGIVGYNVQTAVDPKNHLFVEHLVTNVGSARDQLSAMAIKARAAIGPDIRIPEFHQVRCCFRSAVTN